MNDKNKKTKQPPFMKVKETLDKLELYNFKSKEIAFNALRLLSVCFPYKYNNAEKFYGTTRNIDTQYHYTREELCDILDYSNNKALRKACKKLLDIYLKSNPEIKMWEEIKISGIRYLKLVDPDFWFYNSETDEFGEIEPDKTDDNPSWEEPPKEQEKPQIDTRGWTIKHSKDFDKCDKEVFQYIGEFTFLNGDEVSRTTALKMANEMTLDEAKKVLHNVDVEAKETPDRLLSWIMKEGNWRNKLKEPKTDSTVDFHAGQEPPKNKLKLAIEAHKKQKDGNKNG